VSLVTIPVRSAWLLLGMSSPVVGSSLPMHRSLLYNRFFSLFQNENIS
jgi:hypothetical protein